MPIGNGGGIFFNDGGLTLTNCSLIDNSAVDWGGGIANYRSDLILGNTLLINNFATHGLELGANDNWTNSTSNSFTSQGHNLIGVNGDPGIESENNNIVLDATDLILAGAPETAVVPLADNGGPTQTHALAAGSPAIDAGDNTLVPAELTTDQRGTGFARIVNGVVDIGAFEDQDGGGTLPTQSLTVALSGSGQVTSADGALDCPGTCSVGYPTGTRVTLSATPQAGWTFLGWGGACTGTAACPLTLNAATSVIANFAAATNRYQLDSPVNGSFESGIGVVHGWVCDARTVTLQVDGQGAMQAAYGADRPDSESLCGDTANGFAAAINWNDYGNGPHTLSLLADGQVLTQASVTVTTLGQNYLSGVSGTTRVADFPAAGLTTDLAWSEPHQNFVVAQSTAALSAEFIAAASAGSWESPLAGGVESGRSLIRGWTCEAATLTATLDGAALTIPYGSSREDTQGVCGDTNNGYALAINWADWGDGDHQLSLNLDGVPLETRTFRIATPAGQGTVTGVQAQHRVNDFPHPGDTLTLQWSEPHQNFRLVGYVPGSTSRDTRWRVTEIYIATLGYAPDNEGLQYWIGNIQTGGWTPITVAQSFFDQPAVEALYPPAAGNDALIEALYQNLFGRAPDAEGRAYWLGELTAGRVSRDQMIITLIDAGWTNPAAAADMVRFGHRIEVGEAFAAYQAEHGILFSKLSAEDRAYLNRVGTEVLAGVTAEAATREAAIATIPTLLDPLHD
jgi:hypothetical protein